MQIAISKETICAMLRAFIAQRPGLEFANYGDVTAYRSESRSITKDGHIARDLLRYVELRDSITADAMVKGFDAYSGRLTLRQRDDGKWELDYCTGQYFPTEYRRAAAAVLSSVIWDYFRSDIPADESEAAALFKRYGVSNAGDYLRKVCAREFGRTIANRYFR